MVSSSTIPVLALLLFACGCDRAVEPTEDALPEAKADVGTVMSERGLLAAELREAKAKIKALEAKHEVESGSDAAASQLLGSEGALPTGSGGRGFDEGAVRVVLRPNAVELDGEVLVRLNDWGLRPDGVEDGVIVALRDAIASAPEGRPVVVADATARFEGLALIVATLNRAGRQAHGIVLRDGDALRVFDTEAAVAPGRESADLRVTVQGDGYRVTSREDTAELRFPHRPTIALAKVAAPVQDLDRWDHSKLASAMAEYKRRFSAETTVTVGADRDVPVGAVVAAMEIVRGETCTPATPTACRFVDIHLTHEPGDADVQ